MLSINSRTYSTSPSSSLSSSSSQLNAGADIDEVIDNLYKIAQTTEGKKPHAIFYALSGSVIDNFDTLNQQGNASDMPDKLQEAMVLLIMNGKEENDLSISQHDIITTLDRFECIAASDEIKKAITTYRQNSLETLLTSGVTLYSTRTAKDIKLNTVNTIEMPVEIHDRVMQCLSFKDKLSLSETSQFHYEINDRHYWWRQLKVDQPNVKQFYEKEMTGQTIFRAYPECRLDRYVPFDQKGLAYLKSLGINGPFMRQKIENGEFTIQEAIELQAKNLKILDKVLANPNLTPGQEIGLAQARKYIIDGSMTIDQGINLSNDGAIALGCKGVRKYIDNQLLTVTQAIHLSNGAVIALGCKGVRKYIDNQLLTVTEAIHLSNNAIIGLGVKVMQKYIDNRSLTIGEAIKLSEKLRWNLNGILSYIKERDGL